jgi:ubiquinone biosynthesis protein UbiJ
VDVSAYGLYCHEEYPEETEEVEVEQADGTKTKEKKVIREASEHYSLRYTEVYAVECMYLRREVSRLKQQNENLEQRLKMLEQSVK